MAQYTVGTVMYEKSTIILLNPLTTQYIVENQEKLQVLLFNIVCEVGGEVR